MEGYTAPLMLTSTAPVKLSHRQILMVLAGLSSGMLLAALDATVVGTALPTIVGELGGIQHLSWVVTAYLLTSTVCIPLYGKISDLHGRRVVFQAAILIFLIGSLFCGVAQSMTQLVVARGLQGLGGGGLIAMAMTIVGDIVSPRERGRYQGYVGSVFAFASVGGPLVGGFLVDQLSWRWVFYINLPIGIVALLVTSAVLKLPFKKLPYRIDYLGGALLISGVSCLLLVTVWDGNRLPWHTRPIMFLVSAGIVLVGLFVLQELRAQEPIMPLRLFREPIFSVGISLSFLIGAALLGSMIYLPLFLQTVLGFSATNSGLLMLPQVVGMVATSIVAGRIIARTGQYRIFPIMGTGVLTIGMLLLAQLDRLSSKFDVMFAMLLTGAGIGMVMQVLVLAIQNSVRHRDLGTATSAVNFFRSIGGAFGAALFGAILTARYNLALRGLSSDANLGTLEIARLASSPKAIRHLPPLISEQLISALADAVHNVFMVALPLAVLSFCLSWLLRERPLRDTVHVGSHPVAVETEV